MRGVILAAGKGSRLNGTAGDKPKCLVEAGGVTLIERQIRVLERAGLDDIVVAVGCQADRVRERNDLRGSFGGENTGQARDGERVALGEFPLRQRAKGGSPQPY